MKILFAGDVVGRSGRDAVTSLVPKLRKEKALDFIIVNGDNAAGGFGITPQICKEWFDVGVDVITGGDHIWDQKEIIPYLANEKRLLRPANFPSSTPGNGSGTYSSVSGKKLHVLHMLGQVFHKENAGCPFACADQFLELIRLGSNHAIFIDFHAEATSEKMAMGVYLDGRVSAVAGSHTHVPTQDARILKQGTAYQTDTGMCGDYDSVIGFDPDVPLERFLRKIGKGKMVPASGKATFCALLVETDDRTGKAIVCESLQIKS